MKALNGTLGLIVQHQYVKDYFIGQVQSPQSWMLLGLSWHPIVFHLMYCEK